MNALWTYRASAATHGTVGAFLLLLASSALVLLPNAAALLLVLGLLFSVIKHRAAKGRPVLGSASPLLWSAVLFLLYIVALGWSSNMDYAAFDLQVKAAMLLVPLLVWALPREARVGAEHFAAVHRLASALAVLLCLGVSVYRYADQAWMFAHGQGTAPTTAWFISSSYSLFLHPSYFALHLCFALATGDWLSTGARALTHRAVEVVLLSGILLCASKAGWIAAALYWSVMLVVRWRDVGQRRWRVGVAIGGMVGLALLVLASPFFKEKAGQFVEAAKGAPVDVSAEGSTASREMIWSAALPLITEHMPLGTGTGDVKDVLLARYAELGFTHAVEAKLNAHSQLLQTTLTLGLPGLVALCCLFLFPAMRGVRSGDGLVLVFLGLLVLNWATESMLETQAGVLFLAWGALIVAMRSSPQDNTALP